MIMSAAANAGLMGMQQSQKKLHQAAEDIARAGLPMAASPSAGPVPTGTPGAIATDLAPALTVEASADSQATDRRRNEPAPGDVISPLMEQRQQQLIFDASATVVSEADAMLGRLIDELS